MNKNIWIVIIIIGVVVAVGSIIIDLYLALNGIILPSSIGWCCSMIGVGIIAIGSICGIGSRF